MSIDQSKSELLSRERIQQACRAKFWQLRPDDLTPDERLELMERVRDYLWSIGDSTQLNTEELEALLRLHQLLHASLGEC